MAPTGTLAGMDAEGLQQLLADQDGVVSWAQLADVAEGHDVERMIRRRELRWVHARVYVDHTGPLTRSQREWAAVLYAGRSALCLESALPGNDDERPIHVAIDATRRVRDLPGVRIHRVVGLEQQVQWNLSPPRVRYEHTVLELAHRSDTERDAIRLLTDAAGSRRTTAKRLKLALAERKRTRRRAWLEMLLDDIEHGTCSVLEQGYLTRVERPHGLPAASRQVARRGPTGQEYRDLEYDEFGMAVELDGRTGHAGWDHEGRDADRDLDDLATGRVTARVRWAQVFGRECRTAERVGPVLQSRGWSGCPTPCGPACVLRAAA